MAAVHARAVASIVVVSAAVLGAGAPAASARATPLLVGEFDTVQLDCNAADLKPCGLIPAGGRDVVLDTARDVLYATGSGEAHLAVLDGDKHRVVDEIPIGLPGYCAAFDPVSRRAYLTHRFDNAMSIVNIDARAVEAELPVGNTPLGVAVNPPTQRAYVANKDSGTVSVVDGATRAVVATIPVGGLPHEVAVDPTSNSVYVTHWSSGTVSVIDGASNTLRQQLVAVEEADFLPNRTPFTSIAIDIQRHRAYVVIGPADRVVVIDTLTDAVLHHIEVPAVEWALGMEAIGVNVASNWVYATHQPEGITIIDGETAEFKESIRGAGGGDLRAVEVNPERGRIYVASGRGTAVPGTTSDVDMFLELERPGSR